MKRLIWGHLKVQMVSRNVIDHAIQDGKMREMIIVCPTYNNESPEDSGNYGLAQTLTNNYHNELLNDLMPAVEGKYKTCESAMIL